MVTFSTTGFSPAFPVPSSDSLTDCAGFKTSGVSTLGVVESNLTDDAILA